MTTIELLGADALPPRFWAKVDKNGPDGCWVWTAAVSDTGYGSFRVSATRIAAPHRLVHEAFIGPIHANKQIDHLCRNRLCVNPEHIESVTAHENNRRANAVGHDHWAALMTCRKGHDWSKYPPLLAHRRNGQVSRRCSVCADHSAIQRKFGKRIEHLTAEVRALACQCSDTTPCGRCHVLDLLLIERILDREPKP